MPHRYRPTPPTPDEEFYSQALSRLSGPHRRAALLMRALSGTYWLMMIAALGWLFSQVLDRQPPVTVRSFELQAAQVRPGESLKVAYRLTRHRLCFAETSWAIYDGANEVRRFGPAPSAAAGGLGSDSYVRAWPIPSNAAPGTARLRVVLSFQCPGNYLQAIYPVLVILPEVTFDIVR